MNFFKVVVFIYLCCLTGTLQSKLYCYQCKLSGSSCTTAVSTKIRCKENTHYVCYKRDYVEDGVVQSERDCIRKDFYKAGWPCKGRTDCTSEGCEAHLCNSSRWLTASARAVLVFSIVAVLFNMLK
ncbi:uncharacterized protein LOC130626052 [Hydractinia symbiolongicarpus]|uniref:uncharacterized protein LOC130626052 n=1 Tax=Hydractinia symbiolongicarpus TaxID=13093 RepID=UPI00255080F7|nr:uncharacterized protein LOC130626052 [Hydractinia symbiolongicarpus]